jgi:hypothetical protein
MAQTALTPLLAVGPYPALPITALSLDITPVAGDNVNGNSFVPTGSDLLIVQNSAGSSGTFTISSAPAALNKRTGDIGPYTVGAGLISAFFVGNMDGYIQSDGTVHLACSAATMKFTVLRIP